MPPTRPGGGDSCYDHLAGAARRGALRPARRGGRDPRSPDGSVELGDDPALLDALGVRVPSPSRRRFAFECLDAIHHRPHLGGALGAAVLDALTRQGWVRAADDRVLTVTPAGRCRRWGW